jgi:hypothetical protein
VDFAEGFDTVIGYDGRSFVPGHDPGGTRRKANTHGSTQLRQIGGADSRLSGGWSHDLDDVCGAWRPALRRLVVGIASLGDATAGVEFRRDSAATPNPLELE